jgi:hypothetical protein
MPLLYVGFLHLIKSVAGWLLRLGRVCGIRRARWAVSPGLVCRARLRSRPRAPLVWQLVS